MNNATRRLLSAADQELLLATAKRRLDELDEGELVELHTRVRRARNKYSKLHRRQASAQVVADAARGAASKKNQRTAAKAEVFEDALARVSRRLAAEARRSADELRRARLEAARAAKRGRPAKGKGKGAATTTGKGKGKGKTKGTGKAGTTGSGHTRRGDAALRAPVNERATASARAKGRRAQAKRDAR